MITVLGMMAVGVVVRCGDHDDDKDHEKPEEAKWLTIMPSAYAEEMSSADERARRQTPKTWPHTTDHGEGGRN
jgi:hypothetical protein